MGWLATKCRASTIRTYLFGIGNWHKEAQQQSPIHENDLIWRVWRGIKRTEGQLGQDLSVRVERRPITSSILQKITPHIQSQTTEGTMYGAMFTMATFGLLRLSEFATTSRSAGATPSLPPNVLRWRDITWFDKEGARIHYFDGRLAKRPAEYRIMLQASKTDPFRKGVTIRILSPTAVRAMKAYANVFGGFVGFNEPPFANMTTRQPISRQEVRDKMDKVLAEAGLEPRHYNGHSFRKGGAQSLQDAGVGADMIKAIGRWSSDCYRLYISQTDDALRSAAEAMDTAIIPYQQTA